MTAATMTTTTTTAPNRSLAIPASKPTDQPPRPVDAIQDVSQPPHQHRLLYKAKDRIEVERLTLQVPRSPSSSSSSSSSDDDDFVTGYLHLPPDFLSPAPATRHRTAALLQSAGVVGPGAVYLSLAAKLAALGTGIPTLRLAANADADATRAAVAYLADVYGLDRFVLVGGCLDDDERVVASKQLVEADGDGDAAELETALLEFVAAAAGLPVRGPERVAVVERELVEDAEREELMRRGGEIAPSERR
ncbi:Alpha/Beta hydrolase protein [Xylariomycetidae sp. FL0641]|nr:Alpha/Beta hydrolase protein [Xylariomycetidae sp. FL0641]